MIKGVILMTMLAFFIFALCCSSGTPEQTNRSIKKTVLSLDGVEIAYSVQGKAEPVLVFIHGGFANRGFWSAQMKHFVVSNRVIALDLAGHGDSGKNRKNWDINSFAEDVGAVIKKEKVKKAVLIGNSLGAPVALKTAHLLFDEVVAVVAVDTLQDISREIPSDYYKEQAGIFRNDFINHMKKMVQSLFHPNTYPELMAQTEKQMLDNSPEMAAALMESFADYDLNKLIKNIRIPIRCINGDLYPTELERNRRIYPDFDALVLPDTGHYPMLEKPELFNKSLGTILAGLKIK